MKHNHKGNCWDPRLVRAECDCSLQPGGRRYPEDVCTWCHDHQTARGTCTTCPRCPPCDAHLAEHMRKAERDAASRPI